MSKTKIKKLKNQKFSDCCGGTMIEGVQCEICGSNGKFTTATAIVKRMDKIIKLLSGQNKISLKKEEETSNERFIDCKDGSIKDTENRIMWQKEGSKERLTYAQAEEFVAELNREGFNDWRLPTRKELLTLVDDKRYNPAINPIFKCESAGYWTSTLYADDPDDYAWSVYFDGGLVSYDVRGYDCYVRPCRQY